MLFSDQGNEGTRIVQVAWPEQNHPDGGLGAFPCAACARSGTTLVFLTEPSGWETACSGKGQNQSLPSVCFLCGRSGYRAWLFEPGKLFNLSGLSLITWKNEHSVCMTRQVVRLNEATFGQPWAWHQRETAHWCGRSVHAPGALKAAWKVGLLVVSGNCQVSRWQMSLNLAMCILSALSSATQADGQFSLLPGSPDELAKICNVPAPEIPILLVQAGSALRLPVGSCVEMRGEQVSV